jgi:hypothetical protein
MAATTVATTVSGTTVFEGTVAFSDCCRTIQSPATSDVSDLSLSNTDDEPRDVPKNLNLKRHQRAGDSIILQEGTLDISLFLDTESLSQQYRNRRESKFDKKPA